MCLQSGGETIAQCLKLTGIYSVKHFWKTTPTVPLDEQEHQQQPPPFPLFFLKMILLFKQGKVQTRKMSAVLSGRAFWIILCDSLLYVSLQVSAGIDLPTLHNAGVIKSKKINNVNVLQVNLTKRGTSFTLQRTGAQPRGCGTFQVLTTNSILYANVQLNWAK